MEASEKVRENRVRRMLARQGYKLSRSRRRDPRALDYGQYVISRGAARFTVASIADAEEWALAEPARRARRWGRS
jgi:hypothetical protein